MTDKVLSKIQCMEDGHFDAKYLEAFRRGLIDDLTITLVLHPTNLDMDLIKDVGRRTADTVYAWNGLAGRHGIF